MFCFKKFYNPKILCIFLFAAFATVWFSFPQPGHADIAFAAPPASPTTTFTASPTTPVLPGPGVTLTFGPSDDARIKLSSPSSNYGTDPTLNVDGSIGTDESFLVKFIVQNTGGYPIAKASLWLYDVNESDFGGSFYFIADNSWSEETLNWNNAPAAGSTPIYSLGAVAVNNWYEVDLTSLITGDGVYSLRASSTVSNGADYSSKEGLNPPQLKITLAGGPTATPGPSPTPTLTYTPSATIPATSTFTPGPTATPKPGGYYSFAVIGDYGEGNQGEADVAAMIKSWNVDFIVTLGDNNYPDGGADTIDERIGQYYQEYIYPYFGSFGPGAEWNRFFPSLGNHDLHEIGGSGQPYYDYFTLPGNERYYDIVQGPLHFFILNSDSSEIDGDEAGSIQGKWLQNQLAASTSPWDIVVLHKSPYSSCSNHGSATNWQWPYQEWGADVVMAAHNHVYERLSVNGMPYFVNGLGGGNIYGFADPLPETQVRYNGDYGAMLVEGDASQLVFKFYSRANLLVDTFTLVNSSLPTPEPSPTPSATETEMPSPTVTSSPTSSPEPSPTTIPTATSSPEPSPTLTVTATSTPTETATFTPTATETEMSSPTVTSSPISSPEPSPTITPSPTSSPEPTLTPTETATSTPTATETEMPSPTITPTPTSSPEPSPTTIPTATSSPEPSPTPTVTATSTPTATETETPSPTITPSPTSSPEPSPTPTGTATSTPTATEAETPNPTITPSPTSSPEPSPTAVPTATKTPEPDPTAIPDLIFKDGFESGNLLTWSASATDAGDLFVSSIAALVEQSGLAAFIDDKRAIYVSDASPEAESRYRVRFYLDPHSLQMSSGPLVIFYGYTGSSTQVLRVELGYSEGSFQARAGLRSDNTTWTYTPWTSISDASHFLELDWHAATGVGANDGELSFWIDGIQTGIVTGIDNDRRRIDLVNLGVLAGVDSTTRGTLYFDAFESRQDSYIGAATP